MMPQTLFLCRSLVLAYRCQPIRPELPSEQTFRAEERRPDENRSATGHLIVAVSCFFHRMPIKPISRDWSEPHTRLMMLGALAVFQSRTARANRGQRPPANFSCNASGGSVITMTSALLHSDTKIPSRIRRNWLIQEIPTIFIRRSASARRIQ